MRAGPQRVSAAFVKRSDAPVDDLLAPVEQTLADTQIGSALGVSTLPHLRDFAIVGPQRVTGVSDTPIRRSIFVCRPVAAAEEIACASRIVATLARQAYRRPVSADDLTGLMRFYETGRKGGDFENGIKTVLQAILASPQFIFRLEHAPAGVRPGQNYRISDVDLASRLSFFIWAAGPDDELLAAATKETLRKPDVLEKQVRRMLADPRALALASRFAGQWLRLQDVEKIHPDAQLYPAFDQTLTDAMRRETELLFAHIIEEDRSVLELLTADYTFVNDRLARHYRIPGVTGPYFRRVPLADENRRGLLGQGSILMMTSVADRTSPVLRGKWVLEVLFGSPPPPPPDDVPDLEETNAADGSRLRSVRERLEMHRANQACQSCHRVIDPLGLALESGVDVNAKESTRGQSALMFAVAADRVEAMKLLIARGADAKATTQVVDLTGQTNPDKEEFLRAQRQGGTARGGGAYPAGTQAAAQPATPARSGDQVSRRGARRGRERPRSRGQHRDASRRRTRRQRGHPVSRLTGGGREGGQPRR